MNEVSGGASVFTSYFGLWCALDSNRTIIFQMNAQYKTQL